MLRNAELDDVQRLQGEIRGLEYIIKKRKTLLKKYATTE